MTYDAANDQEPDNNINSLRDSLCIFSDMTVDGDLEQEFSAHRQVERSSNANRPEETNERCLELVFDLADVFMHRKNDWNPTNKEDQNPQKDKPVDRDNIVMRKGCPWTDSTEPHENSQIQQHIDSRLQRVIQRSQAEPVTLCCQCYSTLHPAQACS